MKSIVSIILMFSFVAITLSKSILVVNYELNKKEITEKYCVNKDKPEMHCCGKCLLKKKLAEQEEQQKLPTVPDLKVDMQLFGSPITIQLSSNQNEGLNILSPYTHTFLRGTHSSVFHPPCA